MPNPQTPSQCPLLSHSHLEKKKKSEKSPQTRHIVGDLLIFPKLYQKLLCFFDNFPLPSSLELLSPKKLFFGCFNFFPSSGLITPPPPKYALWLTAGRCQLPDGCGLGCGGLNCGRGAICGAICGGGVGLADCCGKRPFERRGGTGVGREGPGCRCEGPSMPWIE